ncbi:MAG TPA: hypothetical protein PLB88_03575 [Thermoanaerobaculaceae bacterium]|nr:hypothetical protein [Thermoanaerobaculaceae bacterium]HQU33372.1 hypothetical protein [Thermoanaerobaculaceae bacterium]
MRIKYVSHFGPEGQAVAAKRLMLALVARGVELTWTPMVVGDRWGLGVEPFAGCATGDRDLDPLCNRALDYDTVIVHLRPAFYPKWAQVEPGKRLVGHTVWETDRVPRHWIPLLNTVSDVVVPSRWNREAFLKAGVQAPVHAIPHVAVSAGLRRSAGEPHAERADGAPFVFYTIGTWTARKAIPLLVRCYLETFTARDPVRLVLKTTEAAYTHVWHQRFYGTRRVWAALRRAAPRLARGAAATARGLVETMLRRHHEPPEITLVTASLDESEVDALHRDGDCFVSLTHGEGWGLGAFDAAAHGTPVIITGFGGQMEYLDPARAGIVGYDLVPVRDDNDPANFRRDQRWAVPRLREAAELMRSVVARPAEWRERAVDLRRSVVMAYNGERVSSLLLAALGRE